MIIGSLDIQKENSIYTMSTISTINGGNEHPLFSLMLQSFDCNDKFNLSYSNSISSLHDFIQSKRFTINTATVLIQSMNTQIQFLLGKNIAISFIDLIDIMVIDEQFFYFCNCNKLYSIHPNRMIHITDFYDLDNHFLPPEFIHNTMIPFSTHSNSAFYSLAIITLFCLQYSKHGTNIMIHPHTKRLHMYQDILNEYRHTKIFLTLKMCITDEPQQRRIFTL